MNIFEKIKETRKRKGMTQAQLAEIAGLSKGAIGNYESGKRNVSIYAICKISKALGTTPDEFVGAHICPFCDRITK